MFEYLFTEEDYAQNYSAEYCLALSKKISSLAAMPVECRKHVGASMTEKSSAGNEDGVDPFAGMYSGQRVAAMQARKTGRPTHAVLERRYTKVRGHGAKAASSNH